MENEGLIFKAYTVRLRPGVRAQYVSYHKNVWPEVEALLRKSGIVKYRIFLTPDDQLFAVMGMRTEDASERNDEAARSDPVVSKWEEIMSGLQEKCGFAKEDEWWTEIPQVYELR